MFTFINETVLKFIDEEMNTMVRVRANRPNLKLIQ